MSKHKVPSLRSINDKLKLNFGGLVGGLIFFCLSFTPSLLPRGYVLQGFAAGLAFITGYALGVVVDYLFHKIPSKRRFRINSLVKKQIMVGLGVIALVFICLGVRWQAEIRTLTEAPANSGDYPVRIVIIAALLVALILWAARGARHLGRYLGTKLDRFLPRTLSVIGGGILAAILLIYIVNGILLQSIFGVINYGFGLKNGNTPEGIHQPQADIYSGSPQSSIDWNTLGEKGREFVASGPTQADIAVYSGEAIAKQPSRLYVGLKSAPTLQERVDLLVKELDRTNADDKQAILLAIPTGSGGIDAKSVQSIEYLFKGDVSTLGIQYSYLPSWLSFLADQEAVKENGRVLTESVYSWWSHQDASHRPKLLMYGESLGTLGADGAFSGISDIHNRMNGVLLVGPPNSNTLWTNTVAHRDEGTRQVLPTYENGEIARFGDGRTPLSERPSNQPWLDNGVGFLQHGSDPVVWAGTSLALHRPDWLNEQRASDVMPNMRWYPFVTFWQVALDLPFAFNQTPGHGHRYGNSIMQGWADVLHISLTPEETTQLTHIIDEVKG